MRFSGERQVPATIESVWAGLHDPAVLRRVVPGCAQMTPRGDGTYAAALEARVGRIADTYRGTFSVTDVQPGTELRVRVRAGGRFGRLELDLYVTLAEGRRPGVTALRYDAEATVGGMVSRVGRPALQVAGGHFTAGFFRDLERWAATVVPRQRQRLVALG
jgi:carbon monoxide dehydrogenase subunit G